LALDQRPANDKAIDESVATVLHYGSNLGFSEISPTPQHNQGAKAIEPPMPVSGPVAGISNPGTGCAACLCLAQGCGVRQDTGYFILCNSAPGSARITTDRANRFRVSPLFPAWAAKMAAIK
jgi:hypothetical protein